MNGPKQSEFSDGEMCRSDGTKEWWRDGELHRVDGPAIVRLDGSEEWRQRGMRHREDGPAVTEADGTQKWYMNDNLHRADGPALINPDTETNLWYIQWWLVNIEEKREGFLQQKREKSQRTNFRLTGEDIDALNFIEFQQPYVRTFLYVKDNADMRMLQHENPHVSAIAAWNLPIDENYVAVAFKNSFVRTIMQYRSDVPEHLQTLIEVAT